MGGFANILSGFDGLKGDLSTDGGLLANGAQMLGGIAQVGKGIATASGYTPPAGPISTVPTSSVPAPLVSPTQAQSTALVPTLPGIQAHGLTPGSGVGGASGTIGTSVNPNAPVIGTGAPTPGAPISTVPTGTANGVPIGNINGGDFNSVYGDDSGTAITNLFNEEGSGASSTAQKIIDANAPNVAQGSATLNEGLANSGISPSSSVSAIENANYMSGVEKDNLSTEATVGLTEQEQQQQLLESLLPDQKQRQTDSSGWSIFGDIMSGLGDIF